MNKFFRMLWAAIIISLLAFPVMALELYDEPIDHENFSRTLTVRAFCMADADGNPDKNLRPFFEAVEKGDNEAYVLIALDPEKECRDTRFEGHPGFDVVAGKRYGHFTMENGDCFEVIRVFNPKSGEVAFSWVVEKSGQACGFST